MSDTITMTGDYAYSAYRLSGSDADVIDASGASWTLANIGNSTNRYPFQVVRAESDLTILGGTIDGQVSLTRDWTDAYVNSAAVRVADAPGVTIQDWRISQPWDGIRIAGDSPGFTIKNVWISDARDDAIENDDVVGGTISNSLFDGVFSGISLGDGDVDGSKNVVTIDGLLQRSESFLYKGKMTHQSPFKMDKGESPNVTPNLRILNSVFAVEKVDHEGMERLQKAWDKTIEASGNYYLNLSDTPFHSDYPLPGRGFTILQGKAARESWDKARDDWIKQYETNKGVVGPAPAPEPTPEPVPVPDPVDAAEQILRVRINASEDDVEERRSGKINFTSSDLELVDDGTSRPGQIVGLRFNELEIPKGALITRAYVQFQADEKDSGAASLQIRGERADDAAAFTSAAYGVSSRATTSASVGWSHEAWTKAGEAGSAQRTPDLSAVIQEIVGRSGWNPDNSLALIITGTGERTAESYDGDKKAAPLLHVEWKLPEASIASEAASLLSDDTLGDDTISRMEDIHILPDNTGRDYFAFETRPESGNLEADDRKDEAELIYLASITSNESGSGSFETQQNLSHPYLGGNGARPEGDHYTIHDWKAGALSGEPDSAPLAAVAPGLELTADHFDLG